MYWYAGQVLGTQVVVLDDLKASIPREDDQPDINKALAYISIQRECMEALRRFSTAMRDVLYRYAPAKSQMKASREQANFERRFKWAFINGYSEATTWDEDRPILGKWRRWRNEHELHNGELSQAIEDLGYARDAFFRLSERKLADTVAVFCQEAYKEFMLGLMMACNANLGFLRKSLEVSDANRPEWVWTSSRWFPQVIDI